EAFVRDDTCIVSYDIFIKARKLFTIFAAVWLLFKWKSYLVVAITEKAKKGKNKTNDLALITVCAKVSTIIIVVLAGFAVLEALHVPIQALLLFSSIGSLAVSWAAKDVISNFFGGTMIF